MNTDSLIRKVSEDDSEAIANIYNWYITNSYYTFEEEKLSAQQMADRIKQADELNPWFVMEEEGEIVGYCYAGIWKTRAAYKFSRETTVYLKHGLLGEGRGLRLMKYLVDDMRKKPIHVLIAGIALPNEASIAVHEKSGFEKLGIFAEVGSKFDKYIDVAYYQLIL